MRGRLALALLTVLACVPVSTQAQAQSNELRQLQVLRLPEEDPTHSGSVAFDGRYIFYAHSEEEETSTIYRIDPRTKEAAPSFEIAVPSLWMMTYDGKRNHLYAIGQDANVMTMYDVDLATLDVTEMFDIPAYLSNWPHWSYDASIDGFRAASESYRGESGDGVICNPICQGPSGGTWVGTYDLRGRKVSECNAHGPDGPEELNTSTIVAAGDGTSYIQAEDDATLYHVGKDCALLGAGEHPRYSESDENDSMACDTVTFPVPAIWIRDGAAHAIIAYEVPGGYCPLPTRLAPVVGKDTTVGTPVTVCTRLSLANLSIPLVRQPVTLTAEGTKIGTVQTDAAGKVCASYVPRKPGKHRLAGRFAGSRAYLPSSNVGLMKVVAPAVKPQPRRPPAIVIDPPPDYPPQVAPRPAPVTQLQVQPATQTQVQPHVQSQVQAQAAIMPQVQEQVQVARSTVGHKQRDLSMTRYRPRRTPISPLPLAGAAVAVVGMALAVHVAGSVTAEAASKSTRR